MFTVEVKHCADCDGVNNGQNHSMDDGPIFSRYSDDNKTIKERIQVVIMDTG